MVLLHLLGVEIVVPNVALGVLAGFPGTGQGCFQTFLGDVEEVPIVLEVHAEVLGILLDLLVVRLVILVKLFLQELVALCHQGVS